MNNILSSIKHFFVKQQKEDITRAVQPVDFSSLGLTNGTSSVYRGRLWYKQNPYVFGAVNRIQNELQNLPIKVTRDGKVVEDKDFNYVMKAPFRGFDSYSQQIHAFVAYYFLEGQSLFGFPDDWGNGGSVKTKARPYLGGGYSSSFVIDPQTGFTKSWSFFCGNIIKQFDQKDVDVQTPWLYLLQPNGFVPQTETIDDILTASKSFQKFVSNSQNQALNNAPFIVSKEPFSQQEEQRIRAVLQQRTAYAQNGTPHPTIIDHKFEIQPNQAFNFPSTADISKLTDSKSAVAAAFGVPLSFFEGVGAYGTGKSADMAGFVLSTIQGLAEELKKPLSRIAENVFGKGAVAIPDVYSHLAVKSLIVDAIQPFSTLTSAGIPTSVQANILSIKGIEKDYKVEQPALQQNTPYFESKERKGVKVPVTHICRAKPRSTEIWKTVIEEGLIKQKDELREKIIKIRETGLPDQKQISKLLSDFEKAEDSVIKKQTSALMKEGGAEFGEQFDETDPNVIKAYHDRQNLVKETTEELFNKDIKQVISDGVEAGKTKDEIVNDLTASLDGEGFGEGRIKNIAQTETTWAYNAGREQGAAQNGFKYKKWISSGNNNMRPAHRAANGQIKPINEPFIVGGQKLMFPAEGGTPQQCCNCHCTVVYYSELPSKEDDNLILGD